MQRNFARTYRLKPLAAFVLVAMVGAVPALAEYDHGKYLKFIQSGVAATEAREYSAAENNFESAVAEVDKGGATSLERLEAFAQLAQIYATQGKLQKADPSFKRALALAQQIVSEGKNEESSMVFMRDLSGVYYHLHTMSGLRNALELQTKLPLDPRVTPMVQQDLALNLMAMHKYKEAEPLAEAAAKAFDMRKGRGSGATIRAHLIVVEIEIALEKYDQALKQCDIAQKLAQDPRFPFPDYLEQARVFRGTILVHMKKFDQAEPELTVAQKYLIDQKRNGPGLASVDEQLCKVYLAKNRNALAEILGREALQIRMRRFGFETVQDLDLMKDLSIAMAKNGHKAEAEKMQQKISRLEKRKTETKKID